MLVFIRRSWWTYALRGALAMVVGAAVLAAATFRPAPTLDALVKVFGAYIFVEGLLAALVAARSRRSDGAPILLFEGLVGMGAGALAVLWTGASALALLLFVAAWAIVTGLAKVIAAVRLRGELGGEWRLGGAGVLSVVFGVLVLLFPFAGALGMMWLVGIYALAVGAVLLALGFAMRRAPEDERGGTELHYPRPDEA